MLLTLVVLLGAESAVVLADDDPAFRRTTPRGSFGREGPALIVGVPGGRAWGVESALIPVPAHPSAIRATLAVDDPEVREAFVRVAWYDRTTGRPKQFGLADARPVRHGENALLEIHLDPPPGAVAFRLRVLARLRSADALSEPDAVRATLSVPLAMAPRQPLTRLLP